MEGAAHENIIGRQCLALQIETETRFASGFRKSLKKCRWHQQLLAKLPLNDKKTRTGQFVQPDSDTLAAWRHPPMPRE